MDATSPETIGKGTVGTVVSNGHELLLIPEDELRRVDDMGKPKCDHCGELFTPRRGTGGKSQRFCKPECRAAWHVEAQRSPPSPTCSAVPPSPAVLPLPERDDASDVFEWAPENRDVLVPTQPATAVYLNAWGQVVIRQEAGPCDEEDAFIHLNLDHVQLLIDRLQAVMRRQ